LGNFSDTETTFINNTGNNESIDETAVPIQKFTPMKLHVIICISGWLNDLDDIYKPWESLLNNHNTMSSNIYALKFDSKILISLGQAMESMLVNSSITFGVKQLLKQTIVSRKKIINILNRLIDEIKEILFKSC